MDIGLLITSLKSGIGALSAVQSNEVLRERIAFIGEQIDVLQKAHAATVQELAETKAKNVELEKEIAAYLAKDEFVEHMGAAFRKNPSGGYISAVYCPNCLKQVGSGFNNFPYQCKSCGWISGFKAKEIKRVMNSLPE
ncbi:MULTISPECIES: hypothetical protein [Klebsiella]|uniref:hypothetical protein n=1 Tax=Klebsiella TaxID=570 RepID=UPI001C820F97|nr:MULTISPECIES: hypothetical protein [Klebsiella]MBX4756433.1 hypothetical protein [Klebsiella sp. CVUAS 8534.2]MCF0023456.1 hypothetical protein [Klebsiella michiganensis]